MVDRRREACGYIIESLKSPLPKPGRHEPSLDMPCGLLGISGIPLARNRERVGVRAESSEGSPTRKLIGPIKYSDIVGPLIQNS